MKTFLPFLLMLTIVVGAITYLSRRMSSFFSTSSIPWAIVFVLLVILMIVGVASLSNSTSSIGSFGYKVSAITMGLVLYFLISVLILDLVNLFVTIPFRTMGIIAVITPIIIVVLGTINSFNIRTTKIDISINELKKEIKAVHLSDIHIGHFRAEKWVDQIVEKTKAQKPDIVFITGDLFDGRINLNQEILMPFKAINAPIYFVEGNHDNYSGIQEIKTYLRNIGVHVLENEVVQWNDLQIIGFNHTRADLNSSNMHMGQGKTMAEVFPTLNIDQSKPTIFLHHSPDGVEYANKYGVDLYLSGHTHGGQQFPVTLINELLFKYNRGLKEYKGTKVLVSEGVGTFGPPLRIGTKGEVISITLKPGVNK